MKDKIDEMPMYVGIDNENIHINSKKDNIEYNDNQKNNDSGDVSSTQPKDKDKKFLVETIQNIFSKQKIPSWTLIILKWLILVITSLTFSLFWFLLFSISPKKERNFCFSMKDNQLDACSVDQICLDYAKQINIFIYERGDWDKNDFYNETVYVNNKYSKFFVKIAYDLYTKNVYSKFQLNSSNQKMKGVVLLSSREKYIIPLRYNSICEMKQFNIIIIVITALGGICGCIILNIGSDIFGRKPIILISLGIASLSSLGLCLHFFIMELKERKYKANATTYTLFNEILQDYYAQYQVSLLFKRTQFFIFAMGFCMGFALFPLKINLMSLLLENSLNDYYSLYHFRMFNFAECGVAPLIGMIVAIHLNEIRYAFLFYFVCFTVAFGVSFFFLYESMRHLFEYCEWEKLTLVAIKCLPDLKDSDFCNEIALENHRVINEGHEKKWDKEDPRVRQIMLITKRKTLYNSIKKNTPYSISKSEVLQYPLILLMCLINSPLVNKSVVVLLQLIPEFCFASRIYQLETVSIRFFNLKQIYDNIVVSSPIFFNAFVIYFSGVVYFCLWRIMTYKRVMFINGLFTFAFALFYDLLSILTPSPIKDINRYNYSQLSLYQSEIEMHQNKNYLYVVFFFCNGIKMFENLLLLKYSKTLFRCTFFGFITAYQLVALLTVFFISLAYERLAIFAAISVFSMLLSVMYVNQAGEEAYLISDVKRTICFDKRKK